MKWGRKLQGISQTGLHFTENQYDRERYEEIGIIAAEILAEYTNLSVAELIQLNANEFGYATPKVDVRGVIFRDEKILLVRETADAGRWTLPGGWADVNETPSGAVIREVLEESGFETEVVKLLAVYDREQQQHTPPFPYSVYKLFFHCEQYPALNGRGLRSLREQYPALNGRGLRSLRQITGGQPQVNNEVSEIAFFSETELPVRELSESRVTKSQLLRFFKFYRTPNLPTDFD